MASAVACTIAAGAKPLLSCATAASAKGATQAVAERTLRLQLAARAARPAGNVRNSIVVGGQDLFIRLEPTAVGYNDGTQKFTVAIAVRNLLNQPLGTVDLVNPSPGGSGVFFDTDPVVTSGSGVLAIDNSDTTVTIGAHSNRPGFKYPGVIQAAGASAPRTWQFTMPTTVVSAEFTALVFTTLADEGVGAFAQPPQWDAMANGNGVHRCGVRGGKVYCWQSDPTDAGLGQLGAGRVSYALDPVTVAGGHNFMRIAVGETHACGVDTAYNIWCWGSNQDGQFGNGVVAAQGDAFSSAIPRKTTRPAGVAGFLEVAVIDGATCALDNSLHVWCWGRGGFLGTGSAEGSAVPVAVDPANRAARLAGRHQTFCVTDFFGDSVRCWGDGSAGQMGDFTQSTQNLSPHSALPPGGMTFNELAVGEAHVCALANNGHAYCWGDNGQGLRLGTIDDSQFLLGPTLVLGPETFQQISAGAQHTCATNSAKTSYCWGVNASGELGDGTTNDRGVPVPTNAGPVESVVAGNFMSCATTEITHAITCWGLNAGATGGRMSPTNTAQLTPTSPAAGLAGLQYALASTLCVITDAIPTQCLGNGGYGLLGGGTDLTDTTQTPKGILGLANVVDVVTTNTNTCARTSTGGVYCWGEGIYGANGDGAVSDRSLPNQVSVSAASAIVASSAHVCTIGTADSLVRCWGANDLAQLGLAASAPVPSPVLVNPTMKAIAIAAGTTATCAILADSTATCWGNGDPTIVPLTFPSGPKALKITGGRTHFCALAADSLAYCWGDNTFGQLGDNLFYPHASPQRTQDPGYIFADIKAFGNTTCALAGPSDTQAYCWGLNVNSAAGQPSDFQVIPVPTPLYDPQEIGFFTAIYALGDAAACGKTFSGGMVCWGRDIGNVGASGGNVPTIVRVP